VVSTALTPCCHRLKKTLREFVRFFYGRSGRGVIEVWLRADANGCAVSRLIYGAQRWAGVIRVNKPLICFESCILLLYAAYFSVILF
jgi:hypothetical protein